MDKDLSIRVSGLLQSIISSGAPPEEWEKRLREAMRVHARTVKTLVERKMNGQEAKQAG